MAPENLPSTVVATCAACRRPLPRNAPGGMCPACLMGQGVRIVSASQAKPGGFLPPTAEEVSLLFPEFKVLRCLGHGGMGAVYQAVQTELDRTVAIKVLPPETAADPEFTERFRREAATLARLDHPNIVKLFDYGQREGFAYFVMEFVDGYDLAHRRPTGPMHPREVWRVAEPLCKALEHSHQRGVMHRDIKPANVLLDHDGRVKVADFGLARLLRPEDADYNLTRTHAVMGTPRYMAPEQMTSQGRVDHRADIYALGVVIYEILTGSVPAGHFDPPSEKIPALDPRIDDVVLRALSSDPERRFASVAELRDALRAVLCGPGMTRRERSRLQAWRVFGFSLGAAVLGALAVLVWSMVTASDSNEGARFTESTVAPSGPGMGRLTILGRGGPVEHPMSGELVNDVAVSHSREEFGLAVTPAGRVVAWGGNRFGQTSVPEDLRGAVAVAAGQGERAAHALALRADGTVIGWGDNTFQQAIPPSGLSGVTALAAGEYHSIALQEDGAVVVWGKPDAQALSVPRELPVAKAVAAGEGFNLILTHDGRVMGWGDNRSNQCEPPPLPAPALDIAAGFSHGLACLENGRVVAWGDNRAGQCLVPADLPRIVKVFAGGDSSAAIDENGELHVWGRLPDGLSVEGRTMAEVGIGSSVWALIEKSDEGGVPDDG